MNSSKKIPFLTLILLLSIHILHCQVANSYEQPSFSCQELDVMGCDKTKTTPVVSIIKNRINGVYNLNECQACNNKSALSYKFQWLSSIQPELLCAFVDISVTVCDYNQYVCGIKLDGSQVEFNNMCQACSFSNIFLVQYGGCVYDDGHHPVEECNQIDYKSPDCKSGDACAVFDYQSNSYYPFQGRMNMSLCEACKSPGLLSVSLSNESSLMRASRDFDLCRRYPWDPIIQTCEGFSNVDCNDDRRVCVHNDNGTNVSKTYKTVCDGCRNINNLNSVIDFYACQGNEYYKTCDDLDFSKESTCHTDREICVRLADGRDVDFYNPCEACMNNDVLFYMIGRCS